MRYLPRAPAAFAALFIAAAPLAEARQATPQPLPAASDDAGLKLYASQYVDGFIAAEIRKASQEEGKKMCNNLGTMQGNDQYTEDMRTVGSGVANACTDVGVPLKTGNKHDPRFGVSVPK